MKKILLGAVLVLAACSHFSSEPVYIEPEFNRLAAHIRVIDKASNYVVYEYADVRIDEVAPVAAIYCNDRGGRQASLEEIALHQNNRRRAIFVCR